MDLSNKTLAMFLVAAIVISLGGTMLSISKLSNLGITGAALASNATGTSTITVTSLTSLIFSSATSVFGTGQINTTNGNQRCNLTTIDGLNSTGSFCIGFLSPANLTIENAGSTIVNVSINMSQTADTMFGGTAPSFFITMFNASARGGCEFKANFTTQNATTTVRTICDKLNYTDTKDRIDLVINMTFAYDAVTGGKTMTLTASGEVTS